MRSEAEIGKRKEEIFVAALVAIVGADVGFLEVAGDPCEVGVNKETAVDKDSAVALTLGVPGHFSAAYGEVAGFVELQFQPSPGEGLHNGGKNRLVGAHDVEALEGRLYGRDNGVDHAAFGQKDRSSAGETTEDRNTVLFGLRNVYVLILFLAEAKDHRLVGKIVKAQERRSFSLPNFGHKPPVHSDLISYAKDRSLKI